MPMRVTTAAAAKAASPRIPAELLDQLVTGPMTQEGIEEVMRGFKKALIERALKLHPEDAELVKRAGANDYPSRFRK